MATSPNPTPVHNRIIQQGDTQELVYKSKTYSIPGDKTSPLVNLYDLTGCTIKSQFRKIDESGVIASTPSLTLSSTSISGDKIEVDESDAKWTLIITASTMATLSVGDYAFDVECAFPDGKVKKLAKGVITVEFEVTKV